mgnify:CR=1 FL=1
MSTIAFIGLGNMGRPMIGYLLKAGHQLKIYARRPEVYQNEAKHLVDAGAIPCASPAEAADGADFIITNVMSTQDVAEVLHAGKNSVITDRKSTRLNSSHT